jgi:hypothetical protein
MRLLCVWLNWKYLTLGQKAQKTTFQLKVAQKNFSSKINLKHVAEIVFDLRYEFHTN